jgi:L-ascorbate metabolism protein UlaG (beta-lactamase superfamily)
MIVALLIVLTLIGSFFAIGFFLSGPKYKGPVTDHFNGKTFTNPGNRKAKGLPDVFKWMLNRKREKWVHDQHAQPGEKPVGSVSNGVRITFVNHSTFLIQFDGINILTDPVWSERASPFSWAGPKRMRAPGIRFEDLPHIHAILLSHNHYDHLDIQTIKKLVARFDPKVFTALGVKPYLEQCGVKNVTDMDWWEEVPLQHSIRVQSVPAQHFSGRGMFDRDATLWCGFVVKRKEGNIYFAADTGYNETTFKEIGKRCSPIKLALIPIGAFKPEWFMSVIHCSPEEAVKIHQDCQSHQSIATHFGTFPLADDGLKDPENELKKALLTAGIPQEKFIVPDEGTPVFFSA